MKFNINLFQQCRSNNFHAFTLVELLLVMLIIAVVALLTIPNFINNIDNERNEVIWNKAYAMLEQSFRLNMLEQGKGFSECDTSNTTNQINCIKNKFTSKLAIFKDCPVGTLIGKCWYGSGTEQLISTNGTTSFNSAFVSNYGAGFITIDGVLILIAASSTPKNCSDSTAPCATITIDTNNNKTPNKYTSDMYQAEIYDTHIKMMKYSEMGSCE